MTQGERCAAPPWRRAADPGERGSGPSATFIIDDMINPDRLTVKSSEALTESVALARRAGNPVVYDVHLLLALLAQDEGIVVPILQKLGVTVSALREAAEREAGRFPKQSGADPTLSRELNQVLDRADETARSLGDE